MESSLTRSLLLDTEEPLEIWNCPNVTFSCQPEDIRVYVQAERWDLVFNALCYLAGVVDEGLA